MGQIKIIACIYSAYTPRVCYHTTLWLRDLDPQTSRLE